MGKRGNRARNKAHQKKTKQQYDDPATQYQWNEKVNDSDDEEIPEDEAFNSDDERKWGAFFNSDSAKDGSDDDGDDDNDGEMDSDDEEISSDGGGMDSDDDSGDEDEEEEEDDGGQYMLDLLNNLDAKNDDDATEKDKEREDRASKRSAYKHMSQVPESEFSTFIGQQLMDVASGDNAAAKTSSKLTLDHLMAGLQDTKGFSDLQKTMAADSRSSAVQTTLAPMARVKANRLQRKEAYGQQKKEMGGWTQAIQTNRKAETLDFKDNTGAHRAETSVTKDTFVDKFEASNDFERELEQALEEQAKQQEVAEGKAGKGGGDGFDDNDDDDDDDLGRNEITMEEYKHRHAQLAQVRALLSYQEQKHQYMKKIKSKTYRRIRKRQRERQKEKDMEAAIEINPQLELELQEKEEMERIRERLTLAHKNTSKWAKRILKRGKNVDLATRRALSAQLKRGDELRNKMIGKDGSDGDDDDDGSMDEDRLIAAAKRTLSEIENHDMDSAIPSKNKGLFKLSFMQKGLQKQREKAQLEARELLQELQEGAARDRDDFDDTNSDFGDDGDDDAMAATVPKKQKIVASQKELSTVLNKGQLMTNCLEFGNSNVVKMSGGIDVTADDDNDDDHDDDHDGIDSDDVEEASQKAKSSSPSSSSSSQSGGKKPSHSEDGAIFEITAATTSTVGNGETAAAKGKHGNVNKSKKQQKKDANNRSTPPIEHHHKDGASGGDEEENPWMNADKSVSNSTSSKVAARAMASITAATTMGTGANDKQRKPTAVPAIDADQNNVHHNDDNNNDDNKDGDTTADPNPSKNGKSQTQSTTAKSIADMTQDELVRQAFVTAPQDEAVAEFDAEREEMEQRNDPTRKAIDKRDAKLTNSRGWGSWTGDGVKMPPPPPASKSKRNKKRGGNKKSAALSSMLDGSDSRKRKQTHKQTRPNVIINEKRMKKTANVFMLGDVPFPYKSREEYELAMAGGMGKEWNVGSSVKDMTRPEILKRSGKIIQPISKGKKLATARGPAKF